MKILIVLCITLWSYKATADVQDVPQNFIDAANAVWKVVTCRDWGCLDQYNKSNIDGAALDDGSIQAFWRALSGPIDPLFDPGSVAVVKQRSISIDYGQEIVMVRVFSERKGAYFFEVEILGKYKPSRILSLRWLNKDAVIDQLLPRSNILDVQVDY